MAKKDTLDLIREEQKKRKAGAALDHFIIFEDGDRTRLRFFDEMRGEGPRIAYPFYVHSYGGKWAKGKDKGQPFEQVLCESRTGYDPDKCQWCADGSQPKMRVAIRAYVYDDKRVKLFDMGVRTDCISDLADEFDEYGNITRADYIVRRKGEERDTRYPIVRQEERSFTKKERAKKTWINGKRRKELLVARYSIRGAEDTKKSKRRRGEDEDEDE